VAYADLTSDSLERTLDHHQQASGRIRGIRQIISRRADEDVRTGSPALLNDPAFLRGLRVLARRGLSFDLQLTPPLLRRACAVLEEVAELPVALCHAGSPWDQSAAGIDAWAQGLARFAQLPHSVCKLSGWGMFDPAWTGTSLAPFFDHAIAAFGTTRLLWGSNYPVDKLYRGYREICRTSLSLIPDQDRAATFNQNARRFYRIGQG
jgi:predicted TIM-barrel fold metal-dependent hydrolase